MSKPGAYVAALLVSILFFVSIYFVWKHQLDTFLDPPQLTRQAGQPLP